MFINCRMKAKQFLKFKFECRLRIYRRETLELRYQLCIPVVKKKQRHRHGRENCSPVSTGPSNLTGMF